MPVPSSLSAVSTIAHSNSPAGTEDRSTADDYLRAVFALLKQGVTQGADIAAATNIVIPSDGLLHHITGSGTAITGAIGGYDGRLVLLTTANRHKLTHSTNLVLPNAADTYLQPGDLAICKMGASYALTVLALVRGTGSVFKSSELTMQHTDVATVVAHNLGYTPSIADISVVMTQLSLTAEYNQLYVSAVDNTTLTLRRNVTAMGAELKFYVKVSP